MPLPNPWYIDAEARHHAQQQRLLAYAAVEGQEGVLGEQHLAVRALDTPGGAVRVMPGGYSILAKHTGGGFEAYVGKFVEQETVTVNPTDSSGPRTDLVVLRVENPYVVGAGTWSQPADPLNGPYVHVRVIEGVPAGTNDVSTVNASWSAITLARIYRPANTGIVDQSHITDLRSLAKLGGGRVTLPPEEENPPAPPIAQAIFFDVRNSGGVGDDTDSLDVDPSSTFHNWPDSADWDVPVPSWATGADVYLHLTGIRQDNGGTWGQLRVQIADGGAHTTPVVYDFTSDGEIEGWTRHNLIAASSEYIPSALRGQVQRFRCQARVDGREDSDAYIRWMRGSAAILQVVFKQSPDIS